MSTSEIPNDIRHAVIAETLLCIIILKSEALKESKANSAIHV